MSDLELSFPAGEQWRMPTPTLTMDQYHAWVTSHWVALSDEERAKALQESWLEHTGERFSLDVLTA